MTSPRARAVIAVGVLGCLLGGVMLYSVLTDEMTGTVLSTDPDSESQSPTFEADGGGSYSFMATQPDAPDEPVTYDPCEPIRVVVNERRAPDDAEQILRTALAKVEDATGLEFIVDGTTDEVPLSSDEYRDGDEWVPVQISWSDADEISQLAGTVAGLGGSTWVEEDGHRWFVTGEVVLDSDDLADLGSEVTTAVLMHELAHVVGLGHVDDADELMHPSGSRPDWGPGDSAGLEILGEGQCR